MIITCPECVTRYNADAAKFPAAGRKVKCAKCGHRWHQDPPAPAPEIEDVADILEPATPPPTPAPAPPEPPPREPDPEPESDAEPPPSSPSPPEEEEASAGAFTPQPAFETTVHTPVGDTDFDAQRAPSPLAGRTTVIAGWIVLALVLVLAVWAGIQYRQQIATAWPQTASLYGAIGKPVNPRGIEFSDVAFRPEKQDGQSVLRVTGKLMNISKREQPVSQIRAALLDEGGRELYHWTFSPGITTMKPGQTAKFLTRISSPPAAAKHIEVRFAKDGE